MKLHNHSTILLKIHELIRDNLWKTNPLLHTAFVNPYHTTFVMPVIPHSSCPIFTKPLGIKPFPNFPSFPSFPFFPFFPFFHIFIVFPSIPPFPKDHRRKPAL